MGKIKIIFFLALFVLSGCTNAGSKENTGQEQVEESAERTESETENIKYAPLIWKEKHITIPELEKEYEVWFLSDAHIIIEDESAPQKIRDYAVHRKAVFQGDNITESSEIFAEFIRQANKSKPDLILFGGDIIDFPSSANLDFLKKELQKLTIPYLFAIGNHDWTYPWEYMTAEGKEKYFPLFEEMTGENMHAAFLEWEDIVFLTVDNSSNQITENAKEIIEQAYMTDKPIVLIQHVPFSTQKLIAKAKKYWEKPITLGMQIHGGIPVNAVSDSVYKEVLSATSDIRLVLSGHVHFSYEEALSEKTTEIIADAAFKGTAVKLYFSRQQ